MSAVAAISAGAVGCGASVGGAALTMAAGAPRSRRWRFTPATVGRSDRCWPTPPPPPPTSTTTATAVAAWPSHTISGLSAGGHPGALPHRRDGARW